MKRLSPVSSHSEGRLYEPSRAPAHESTSDSASDAAAERPIVNEHVYAVHRLGAVIVGLMLLVFGILGFVRGVPLLSTVGRPILGLSSNGLLAGLSVVVAAILVGAAVRGPRVASTVMIALGVLFLLSGLVNLALLQTSFNVLAFTMSNVIFSFVVGLLLLMLGAYGRISGSLPSDSPYAHPHPEVHESPDLPTTPEAIAAEAGMREAEIAVAEHHATDDQRRRVQAMAPAHSREERRRIWMQFGEVQRLE